MFRESVPVGKGAVGAEREREKRTPCWGVRHRAWSHTLRPQPELKSRAGCLTGLNHPGAPLSNMFYKNHLYYCDRLEEMFKGDTQVCINCSVWKMDQIKQTGICKYTKTFLRAMLLEVCESVKIKGIRKYGYCWQ